MSRNALSTPPPLPLKNLNLHSLISLLGEARATLARLDATLNQYIYPLNLFLWDEALSSLQSQHLKLSLKNALLYTSTSYRKEKEEPSLQKALLIKQALDAALQWSSTKRLGKRFFCQIQGLIKEDALRQEDIGSFRNRQNWIGMPGCSSEEALFHPPPFSKIDRLFSSLQTYYELQSEEPLIQTAISFAQFLIIHPFMDGNGRTGRVFIPFYAMRRNLTSHPALFLSRYFETHRREYFERLYHLTEKNGWEHWIQFFLRGVIEQAKRMNGQMIDLHHLYQTICDVTNHTWGKTLLNNPVFKEKKSKEMEILKRENIVVSFYENIYFIPRILRIMNRA